jgi:predicted dehydrogenase
MRTLNVAIIGYGRSGRDIHTHLLNMLPDHYRIVAYAEIDEQRRDMIQAERRLDASVDYTGLFGRTDLNLVVNASFSHQHAEISRALLQNGFDVLSEKPAARNEAEFDDILETARSTGRRYFVFQQYRFSPAFLKIRDIIASGQLGRIVQISLNYDGFARRWDWQTIHAWGGGSLLNTGPHPVDHALALLDFPKDVQVCAAMDCAQTSGDGEDYVKLILKAKDRPVVDIEISSCHAYAPKTFLVQGTHGTLYGGTDHLDWTYYRDDENPPPPLQTRPLRNEKGEPLYCREKLVRHTDSWDAAGPDFDEKGKGFYIALYETLVNGAPFAVTSEQVKQQLQVIDQAHAQNRALFDQAF